jgi:hypothetical protein
MAGVLSQIFMPGIPSNTSEGLHAQVLELDSALVAARAEFNDRQYDAETRVRSVETTGLQNSAQLGAIFDTLQTLMAQVSALQAQSPPSSPSQLLSLPSSPSSLRLLSLRPSPHLHRRLMPRLPTPATRLTLLQSRRLPSRSR